MEKEQKITLARISVSLLMLAGAWLFESDENIVQIIFYAAAYLVIGGDIVFNAVRNVFHGEIFDENFLMAVATIGPSLPGNTLKQWLLCSSIKSAKCSRTLPWTEAASPFLH